MVSKRSVHYIYFFFFFFFSYIISRIDLFIDMGREDVFYISSNIQYSAIDYF